MFIKKGLVMGKHFEDYGIPNMTMRLLYLQDYMCKKLGNGGMNIYWIIGSSYGVTINGFLKLLRIYSEIFKIASISYNFNAFL